MLTPQEQGQLASASNIDHIRIPIAPSEEIHNGGFGCFYHYASGKPLLSRQFKDLSKDRVLELLSNFQNLVSEISSDHTFVEDKHVRYVYRPFDNYYIILITNRQSNIIKDLATLNLFSQTINSYLSSFQDQEIFHNAFEILSSFDEIVSMGGYKENLSFTQVQTYLSMESHEERIQEIIERNKEIEATEERKRRAKEIARKEHERKHGFMSSNGDYDGANRFMGSKDPNVTNAINSYYSHASPAAQQSYLQSSHAAAAEVAPVASPMATSQRAGHSATGGMKLGGGAGRRAGAAPRPSAISSASSGTPPPPEEGRPREQWYFDLYQGGNQCRILQRWYHSLFWIERCFRTKN